MDIKLMAEQIQQNNILIDEYRVELKDVEPDIPLLTGYQENDWIEYLAQQGIFETHAQYNTYKDHLETQYKKRQNLRNNIGYRKTYNLILQKMIIFYKDNLRDPTEEEIKDFAENTGIQEHIDDAISEIMEKFL